MDLPNMGEVVTLFPAPQPDAELKQGLPLRLRRVQDGVGNYRRFLPDEGAERPFDHYWHDRLVRGDVLLVDPRKAFARAVGALPSSTPGAPPPTAPAPLEPPLPAESVPPEP